MNVVNNSRVTDFATLIRSVLWIDRERRPILTDERTFLPITLIVADNRVICERLFY